MKSDTVGGATAMIGLRGKSEPSIPSGLKGVLIPAEIKVEQLEPEAP